ncbi:hypothetical protein BASA50_006857 [Batrachochytrium salamandrivorans]|uniref:mannose-1-phosphate guanylyltransferase n=1 Tax=Batrachochytrium salamandrivorans TaxID=1357716 RepID=A0ABQ8F8Q4_9FUNG|nr:hypothetical protein BASA62_008102 [Batrachochytrium salamandrivorans]KAH6572771.1 hypothetical protein BASA60_006446 [Batrachochytrium salamandrivorans]KAH6594160.1 hypothetical protein BASA50_006857 [Batrachochytrium salamandrivorans]KAH6601678.1 hypothetical protein BASA61_001882 [Batrachochytrium salamandrivorans]KAH9273096.1 hypothetical protein BASA83_004673 [Batrachochytrium salamandrivorans]
MSLSLKGVILVGGPSVGTRFRPLSMDCPKPLFPIAGVPMIHHHVLSLAKTPGMKEILLIGFFDSFVFDRFITEVSIEFPHVTIRYLREYQSLGTGGGVYHFRDEILRGSPQAFFVLNGDVASSFPLNAILAAHRTKSALATIMGMRIEKEKANRYGCIVADPETSQVVHFVEKPHTFISDLISCGVYLLSCDIFSSFSKAIEMRRTTEAEQGLNSDELANISIYTSNMAISSRGDGLLQLEDVLRMLADEGSLYVFEISSNDFWMPIKHGSSAIPANRKYLQYFLHAHPRRLSEAVVVSPGKKLVSAVFAESPAVTSPAVMTPLASVPRDTPELIAPVYIHPTAVIHPSAKIGPNVSIGPRVLVGRGVRIRDSIILDTVEIKNDSCLMNAIVGWNCTIGSWARVEGSADQGDSTQDGATSQGYKVPTAAILGKGVTVCDEIIVRDCIVLPHKELKASFQREILM